MGNELVVRKQQEMTFDEMTRAAKAMAMSGYFSDAKDVSQAMVKVLAGQELGIGPFSAMSSIHVIKGKPVLGANLIATLIKNDQRYNYRVAQLDDDGCVIDFYEDGEQVGTSSFTAKDAKAAGLRGDNWSKYPRNMFFARAISNGAKWYTPGVFSGATVYTADEMGIEEDEDGGIIDVTPPPIDNDTGEILDGDVVEDEAPASDNGSDANDKPRPFFGKVLEEVGYFKAVPHVESTMNLLDIEYPQDAAAAKHALATLAQYATLRADGTEQEAAVKLLQGELALDREDA